MLHDLLEGCTQDRDGLDEQLLTSFIESVCWAVPSLYEAAGRARGELATAARADLLDIVRHLDLWAMLISLTSQASVPQRRRIHSLIGKFVKEVSSEERMRDA